MKRTREPEIIVTSDDINNQLTLAVFRWYMVGGTKVTYIMKQDIANIEKLLNYMYFTEKYHLEDLYGAAHKDLTRHIQKYTERQEYLILTGANARVENNYINLTHCTHFHTEVRNFDDMLKTIVDNFKEGK